MCIDETSPNMALPLKSAFKEQGSPSVSMRSVSFAVVEVREFPVQLGGHNVCSEGCPVSMGYDPLNCGVYSVEDFEEERSQEGRGNRESLHIPVGERARLLLTKGYSIQQITKATKEAQAIRRDRLETLNRKKLDRFQFVVESAGRKLKRVVRLQPKIECALSA
jgi:hypothetical protein